ncbi:hypothetical protein BGZ65_002289 [Modicella reniformis]|uniref:Sterol regulatory element-binding protein cleavage-activating protein n=1 Tax=Modicella reniformis TaxID=1440133 RepID=A0A9P6STZ3_9FUNG|nr:hypothetical protein BGZ65_002289 [Modicella reniformis]
MDTEDSDIKQHDLEQISSEDKDGNFAIPSSSLHVDGFQIPFMVRVTRVTTAPRRVSRRLVTEESAQLHTNISAEYWLLATAYFVMFFYISLSVGKVDLVKSKYGLGIAAVATVFVSLLMSIGICSVFGVTLTLMPWEILPFMIIVVGVENINILVHAVVETSLALPVRERVGLGLGTVGVSITLTLVSELCLLVVGAMTTIPAVQEFCTFAIAAVIMDYLLQMTFFITVISIDIRRLELSDLSTHPTVPCSRNPFGARHAPLKSGHIFSEVEASRYGDSHVASGPYPYEDEQMHHRRSGSSASHHSDGESTSSGKRAKPNRKLLARRLTTSPATRCGLSTQMLGVMGYLGYIYGTTNQPTTGEQDPIMVSYWRLVSTETASEFWRMVDPSHTGGYLEIGTPIVVSLEKPSNASHYSICHGIPDAQEIDDCDDGQDGTASYPGQGFEKSIRSEGLLDPKRHFKLLWDALIFIWLFAIWLVRVFVIPSIISAAAILLLLSYLLSPQRKLLVDLQWRFPFIVLPGDYQSKRKLMIEELLAQEALELGQELGPSVPLPGTVETLHQGGHKGDIDQMDISADGGLILTSSLDGVILLWNGSVGAEQRVPIARLEEDVQGVKGSSSKLPKSRPVKFLKLDPAGDIAIVGFGDGGVRVWRLDSIWHRLEGIGAGQVLRIRSSLELARELESTSDLSKLRVSSVCFWDSPSTRGTGLSTKDDSLLLVGYRDGQIWQWNLITGEGRCIMETKYRGGVAELAIIELNLKTRQDLGLRQKTYLVIAGKDGGIQCWSIINANPQVQKTWTLLWGHSGMGAGVSVLSLDTEMPMVAAGYSNGAIKVWDLEQGNIIWTLSRGSVGLNHPDRRHSQEHADNHQPSHQGAVTKICFHALEVEDERTGKPAPRVWLVISSSTDETVMVWMVEWEGMLCMPTLSQPGHDPSTSRQATSTLSNQVSPNAYDRRLPRTSSFGPNDSLWGSVHTAGSLSSSLPAPRLVGFMKQRGGKSMTVHNSYLYGVRRTESSATLVSDRVSPRKQSHASVLDAMSTSSSSIIRSRRKSDSHGLLTHPMATPEQAIPSSGSIKRGWELWEADLYNCIFKRVWELDLAVRTIDLQPSQPPDKGRSFAVKGAVEPRHVVARASESQGSIEPTGTASVIISTNGSSMAVPAFVNADPTLTSGHDVRPRLQRKSGSFTHQTGQRGYVFTAGLTKASQHPQPTSTASAEYSHVPYSTSSGFQDDGDPVLLPFVETRLVLGLSRRTNVQPTHHNHDAYGQGKEHNMKDIVIGFGNFIKIVRLQDEDEGENGDGLRN